MSANPNPPAFPLSASGRSDDIRGMSLRDWFAGKSLQGFLSSEGQEGGYYQPDHAAERAYLIADAMLAARQKGPTS